MAQNDIDLHITDKVALLLSKPKRIKILVGGRGSSKSIGVADIMLMFADNGRRICCAREFQNSIEDSVHELMKQEIARLNVAGVKPTDSKIRFPRTGGSIFYKGLARNITSLKSLAGVDYLWIEEGESVSERSLAVLTPSVRSKAETNESGESSPEIWITMNRGSTKDAIAKRYLKRAEKDLARCGYYEDDLLMVVEVNYQDNPWFPPELEQERKDDEKNLPFEEYDHIWNGRYNDTVKNALIKPEWFNAAIDAHKVLNIKTRGIEVVAHDPSDEGGDKKGLAYRHGILLKDANESSEGDVNEGGDWALDYALDVKPDVFSYDADGMGAALKRQIHSGLKGKRIMVDIYKGSNSPDNPDEPYVEADGDEGKTNRQTFLNKRAQAYWMLRDRFYRTYRAVKFQEYSNPDDLISINGRIELLDSLKAELCRIPLKPNGRGLIQIMSKTEMRKMGIDSPNMADSVAMAFSVQTQTTQVDNARRNPAPAPVAPRRY
jgi:phage terminase large subunit